MPPVSQRVPDLLGGVSQLAPHRRKPNELEDSLNAYHSPARGFGKRPPTEHVGVLSASASAYVAPTIFTLDYGSGERFYAAFLNGDLKVWRSDGVEQAVSFPDGKGYLDADLTETTELVDDFTGTGTTDLNARQFGSITWTRKYLSSGITDVGQISSNALKHADNSGKSAFYTTGITPAAADYSVRIKREHASTTDALYLGLRVDASTGAGYFAKVTGFSTLTIAIVKRTGWAGAEVSLASNNTIATPGNLHTILFSVAATALTVTVDGVLYVSTTDSTYASAGVPALGLTDGAAAFGQVSMDDFTFIGSSTTTNADPNTFRSALVGNRMFVANRHKRILRDTSQKAPVQTPRALLYIEQADYSTRFEVTLDGVTVSYETDSGSDAGARRSIATDFIATQILTTLQDAFASFTFEQYGSMILVRRTDDTDFAISARDGLGDNGLRVVKGKVQQSADLPLRGLNGFVVEVSGDPESARDNYWVIFDADGSDDFRGVWKECPRPGEGIALDPTTMPHELVYSDERTPHIEHRGLPSLPPITLYGPVRDLDTLSQTLNGADLGVDNFAFFGSQGDDYFVNLEDTNGGPIRLAYRYSVDTTKMTAGKEAIVTVSVNNGASSTTWTEVDRLTFGPGVWAAKQLREVEISTDVGVNWDIRFQLTYADGATPSSPARFGINSRSAEGFAYFVYTARDLSFPTATVYPASTAWTVVVNGNTINFTQTADMTGAELAAHFEPIIEALTDITSSLVTTGISTAVRISKTTGVPSVTVAASFDNTTRFWNPDVELAFADDALIGYTIKNLSDGSEGVITDNDSNGVTVAALTGGVENVFRDEDLCVIVGAGKAFIFREVAWEARDAGSTITNPWPSFVDDYARDVFFYRGRLGILSGGHVIMSESGTPENFFRTATTDLLDSDPIDVAWAGGETARFHAAIPWNGEMVFFGDRVQVVPRGEPVFSPKTVRLELLSVYPCDPSATPEPAGRWVFFGRPFGDNTQMQALGISPRTRTAEAKYITANLPTYLSGEPLFMASDPAINQLFLVTDADQSVIYHLRYQLDEDVPPELSWGKWTFHGTILGMDCQDGTLALLMKYSSGVCLETLDLSEDY